MWTGRQTRELGAPFVRDFSAVENEQITRGEWFGNVVVGTCRQTLGSVFLAAAALTT